MGTVRTNSLLKFSKLWQCLTQDIKTYLSILKIGGKSASLHDSKVIFSFQTFRLKIHRRQSSYNTVFFLNIKITGTKDVQMQVRELPFSSSRGISRQ